MRTVYAAPIALISIFIAACELPSTADSGNSRYLAAYGPASEIPRAATDPGAALPDDISYWAGDGVTGRPLIKINRNQQKSFFYKGNTLVGVSRISTGKEGYDTPPGTYKVTQKNRNHRSNLYGVFKEKGTGRVVNDDVDTTKDKLPPNCYYEGAPMYNFLRFNGGVGMHTGYLPGYNASHGCVRLPDKMARKFFDNAEVGTPVVVE